MGDGVGVGIGDGVRVGIGDGVRVGIGDGVGVEVGVGEANCNVTVVHFLTIVPYSGD